MYAPIHDHGYPTEISSSSYNGKIARSKNTNHRKSHGQSVSKIRYVSLCMLKQSLNIDIPISWHDVGILSNAGWAWQKSQQTRYFYPILVKCWSTVCGAGPTLQHHWVIQRNVSALSIQMEKLYGLSILSKHETLNQCWFNVGPASQTVGQH